MYTQRKADDCIKRVHNVIGGAQLSRRQTSVYELLKLCHRLLLFPHNVMSFWLHTRKKRVNHRRKIMCVVECRHFRHNLFPTTLNNLHLLWWHSFLVSRFSFYLFNFRNGSNKLWKVSLCKWSSKCMEKWWFFCSSFAETKEKRVSEREGRKSY